MRWTSRRRRPSTGLGELGARYASYEDLADVIRHRFEHPRTTLRELFGRLVFNILCGNTDDHARNHAAFWDGARLTLTPAYDICPQARTGQEATQAMKIIGDNRFSRLAVCLDAAPRFQLSTEEARNIIDGQLQAVATHWRDVCEAAGLGEAERNVVWGRQFLNPFAMHGYGEA